MAATTQQQPDPSSSRGPTAQTRLELRGPYDLEEVALMGFGHRDEQSFDSVMRLAFCVDGDYERQVGVEVRQAGQRLDLTILGTPGSGELDETTTSTVARQVARVLSADQDGDAFARVCAGDPVLARLHAVAPGFRPALFYSPYEAALWSILSARRPRAQGIALRERLGQEFGATFDLAGVPTTAVPTPSGLMQVEALPGLPADRVPRLQAIAEAAREGRLSAARLAALEPEQALTELQELPGIGPFYSTLILVRACGVVDVLPETEGKARELVRQLYDWPRTLSDSEYAKLAEQWRPFRTWAAVLVRAMSGRLDTA
jgi:DNA-3-methyladenine glycosylase II